MKNGKYWAYPVRGITGLNERFDAKLHLVFLFVIYIICDIYDYVIYKILGKLRKPSQD